MLVAARHTVPTTVEAHAARHARSRTSSRALAAAFALLVMPHIARAQGPGWRAYTSADGLGESWVAAVTVGGSGRVVLTHGEANATSLLDGYGVNRLPAAGDEQRVFESTDRSFWSCRTAQAPGTALEAQRFEGTGWKSIRVEVPVSTTRIDGHRAATVSATPAAQALGALTQRLRTALEDVDVPPGASLEVGGVAADQEDAFADLGLALLIAIVIVYVVMVATFRSLLQPLILMVSVPFAATGALLGLLLTGTPLGVPALIGVLMLIGVVVTNAIVLVDLVNQYRERGRPLAEAVVEGSRKRLRPIVMTAAATIFALVPMALGLTGGGVFISQPLAIVVIGGLFTSTLLTLVLVPVLYTLVEGARERRRARREPQVQAEPVAQPV